MNLLPDLTILPMWLIFMATMLTLNHFVFKPTLAILSERNKRTEGSDKEVVYFTEQTQIKLDEYENLMNDAWTLARSARDEVLREAEATQKEILTEARSETDNKLNAAHKEVQTQANQARSSLAQSAAAMAKEITNKLIDRKVA